MPEPLQASDDPAGGQVAAPRDDAALPQFALQGREGAEREIALEDQTHGLRFIIRACDGSALQARAERTVNAPVI